MNQKAESITTRIKANPERWQRLKNILADALEETSVEQRAAMLRQSCADDQTLLREAEKLLAHDTTAFEEFAEFAATRLRDNECERIGERIGAYAIVRELGRGGMGAVYLAERADGQFEKRVAIKVLKRGTDTDEVLRRFRIERQILANLEHPNITRLLDAGSTTDGLPYFVMEFIEGMPITRFVECENVNLRDRLKLFLKVCSAVVFAHQNQIVHRDIKPSNVLVNRDVEPKLLDFGIAKLLCLDANDADTTIPAQRRLTPMYAAPEQRAGCPATNATDVYSLGALLYELLTAHPPCSSSNGNLLQEDVSNRSTKPQLPSQVVTDPVTKRQLQGQLDHIVMKAMRNEPAQRYSSVTDLSQDIVRYLNGAVPQMEHDSTTVLPSKMGRRNIGAKTGSRRWYAAAMGLGGIVLAAALLFSARNKVSGLKTLETAVNATGANSPSATSVHSIAVLPFENLSTEKENAFFADGVQEEILTNLDRIADLKVIGRTSVMQYNNRVGRDLRKIGQQLGVAHVLEGSIQRSGNRVRVNVELIDARTDKQLWAHTYDRDLADVFAIQSEIAKVIAEELQAKLSPNEKSEIERPPTNNIRAFDLYTHANNLFRMGTDSSDGKADLLEAADLLDQAVALDPLFFRAYCRLARVHNVLYFLGHDHSPSRVALAEAAIQAAFRLRPKAGEAHLARAENLYRGYLDYDGALDELEVARQSLPNDSAVFQLTSYIQRRQGRWEESTRNLERALDLDPRDTFTLQQMAWQYSDLRRYAEVKPLLARVLAINPNNADTEVTLASVDFHWKADTRPLHQMIESMRATNPVAIPLVADTWLISALAERDASGANDALSASGKNMAFSNEAFRFNRPFMEGVIARMMKDNDKARAAFTAARAEQEKIIQAQPNYGPPMCVLGLIDAALGRKEEALREGRRAVELLPVQKDAVTGPLMTEYSAMIAAWVGENELACEQLTAASRYPGPLSYGELKLLPFWDPLRGDPRFEQIVASLAPKETSSKHN